MGFYDAIRIGASGAVDSAFKVDRSLRFNDDDNAYLNRTPTSASNRRTWTWSGWIKRCTFGAVHDLFSAYDGSAYNIIRIGSNDQLNFQSNSAAIKLTNAKLRDPSAWYHIVVSVDTTNSTAADRVIIYINDTRQTLETDNSVSQNTDYAFNTTYAHTLGIYANGSSYDFDGYMAEVNFIDGQQLTPSSFGETDATTGQWNPIDTSGLTFGTNGFYLKFADNSGTTATTLGKDSSGNGNNFTPNNFSVSAGAGNDSVEDSPTNNFCTLNPLTLNMGASSNGTVSNGNLEWLGTSANDNIAATMAVKSGKWYYEMTVGQNADKLVAGWTTVKETTNYTESALIYYNSAGIRGGNITVVWNSTVTSSLNFATNDVIGFALNLDDYYLYVYENGSLVSTITLPTDKGDTWIPCCGDSSVTDASAIFNFGQRAFDYTQPTGYKKLNSTNLPDPTILLPNNHFNTLLYTGTGSSNSVTGLDFAPDWVWVKGRNTNGYEHMLIDVIRGGNASLSSNSSDVESTHGGRSMTFLSNGVRWNADSGNCNANGENYVLWNWNAGDTDGKTYTVTVVSDSGNKFRFDGFGTSAVTLDLAEGGTYIFNMDDSSNASHPFSIGTAANGTVYTSGITYFLDGVSKTYSEYTSGFAAATTRRLHITVPASAPVLYYWCSAHSGMGGQINTNSTLGSSNFDGNNQSTVKVNATAGFSIVSYTGNGTNNSNVTMGHGLGVAPDAVILKNRDTSPYGAKEWVVWHQDVGTDSTYVYKNLSLNSTGASSANSDQFRTVDASTIQVRSPDSSNGKVNANNNKYIAYVFSGVSSYSKFGSYTGNGSSNGPYVFLGFKPAYIMVKRTDSSNMWLIMDNTRYTYNVHGVGLKANGTDAEFGWNPSKDFLSNGFKIRTSDAAENANGGTYIYLAFAESPFKNARAI